MTRGDEAGIVNINLYWAVESPLDKNYTTFIHLLKADGSLAAQSDVLPANGLYPTSAWRAGDVVLSHHQLSLADLAPGYYSVVAGLYLPENWERLPGVDNDGMFLPDNAASLGEITIE
jgi:hypothetical protein